MTKFTKEERSLCKQVAEKHRKDIKYGDWFIWEADKESKAYLWKLVFDPQKSKEADQMVPLWTISDCLEWLMTKGTDCGVFYDPKDKIWKGYLTMIDQNCIAEKGKTPLEACLKSVLAVIL